MGLPDAIKAASLLLPESAYFGIVVRGRELVVFTPLRSPRRGGAAFAVPVDRLSRPVDSFLARDPLLPRSLSRGASLDSGLAVRLVSGATTIGARGRPDPSGFQARQALGELFGDLTIELTVARSLAPRLIIGDTQRPKHVVGKTFESINRNTNQCDWHRSDSLDLLVLF